MMKSFFDFATFSEAPLLIQIVVSVVYVMFTFLAAIFVYTQEVKPKWLRYSIYISLFLALHAFFFSWEEKRIFAAWAENFLALVFRYGSLFGGIACGYFVGIRITGKTSKLIKKLFPDRYVYSWTVPVPAKLFGWVVGIAIAILIMIIILMIGEKIPGVGWRIKPQY